MPSPTPNHVAIAYADNVRQFAGHLAGKDGRLTAKEASHDPYVADAYARTGKKRPVLETVAGAAREAMLAEARRVDGGDGRVSKTDAAKMSPLFAKAFEVMRAKQEPAASAVLADKLEKTAEGLLFMSESDDPYTGFHVPLDPQTKIDGAVLERVLIWDAEPGDEHDEYDPYPVEFQVEVDPEDDFWSDTQDLEPGEAAKYKALEDMMKKEFVESTGADGRTGKIWTATVREEDSSRAPYYIFGRMESGELVGLKTWRTWT